MTALHRPALAGLLLALPLVASPQQPAPAPGPKVALVPISAPKPEIADAACQQRLSGWVEMEFAVLPDGRVAEVRVIKSQPAGAFDAAATAAVGGRLYAPLPAPVKMKERMLMTYADCRAEQLKGVAGDAAAGQLSAQACVELAAAARAAGERFELAESGRGILAETVAQVYAAPSPGCPVLGKTLKPGARWRAHLAYEGWSLISPPKADESAAVWVRSSALKDVDLPGTPPPAVAPPAVPATAAVGAAASAAVTSGPPADAQQLLALHANVLKAHLSGDVELLLGPDDGDFVQANRGAVTRPDRAERKARLGPYLKSTRFSVYRDQVPPVVKVSADGTLGWVIAQVEARGEQTGPDGQAAPLEFVSAWVELYEKRNGRWVAAGNVSSFRP